MNTNPFTLWKFICYFPSNIFRLFLIKDAIVKNFNLLPISLISFYSKMQIAIIRTAKCIVPPWHYKHIHIIVTAFHNIVFIFLCVPDAPLPIYKPKSLLFIFGVILVIRNTLQIEIKKICSLKLACFRINASKTNPWF